MEPADELSVPDEICFLGGHSFIVIFEVAARAFRKARIVYAQDLPAKLAADSHYSAKLFVFIDAVALAQVAESLVYEYP